MCESLIIREIQIKTTVRYHLSSGRLSITKKTKTESIGEDVKEREPCWWDCQAQPLWETVLCILKKLNTELLHYTAIPVYIQGK